MSQMKQFHSSVTKKIDFEGHVFLRTLVVFSSSRLRDCQIYELMTTKLFSEIELANVGRQMCTKNFLQIVPQRSVSLSHVFLDQSPVEPLIAFKITEIKSA